LGVLVWGVWLVWLALLDGGMGLGEASLRRGVSEWW
jgi:hypothetical protein